MDQELTLDQQKEEILKCKDSFEYFCRTCVKIYHPKYGIIPFKTHDYQMRLIRMCEDHCFVIGTKFRQGGFTTVSLVHRMWECLFKKDHRTMYLTKNDRWARECGDMVKRIIAKLPSWIRPGLKRCNDHFIEFEETDSQMHFCTPIQCRGKSFSNIIVDEPAFSDNFESDWKMIFPSLSCGSSVLVLSTPNGVGNWFEETYHNAVERKNSFVVFYADYTEHPDYANEQWVKMMKENLGEAGWQQEVLQNFIMPG